MSVNATEILGSELDEDRKQVAAMVAGYSAIKLSKHSKRSKCQFKLVVTSSGIEHYDYLQQLSHGGLNTPFYCVILFSKFLVLFTLFHQQ